MGLNTVETPALAFGKDGRGKQAAYQDQDDEDLKISVVLIHKILLGQGQPLSFRNSWQIKQPDLTSKWVESGWPGV
jgi:hypothetical protein